MNETTPNGSGAVMGPDSYPANEGYEKAREFVTAFREQESRERLDAAAGEAALRQAVGNEFSPVLRLVNEYLDRLPAEKRQAIEDEVLPNGVRALNDPAYVLRLGVEALGPLPTDLPGVDREIAALEQKMRTDRTAWFRDHRAQVRLRALYRMKST